MKFSKKMNREMDEMIKQDCEKCMEFVRAYAELFKVKKKEVIKWLGKESM